MCHLVLHIVLQYVRYFITFVCWTFWNNGTSVFFLWVRARGHAGRGAPHLQLYNLRCPEMSTFLLLSVCKHFGINQIYSLSFLMKIQHVMCRRRPPN